MRELTPVLIHFLYVLCRFGIDSLLLQCCRPLKPQSGISISRMHLSVCGVSLVPAYVVYTLWFMRFWIFFMWMAGTDLFLAGPYTIHAHVFKLTVYVTSFLYGLLNDWMNEWMNEQVDANQCCRVLSFEVSSRDTTLYRANLKSCPRQPSRNLQVAASFKSRKRDSNQVFVGVTRERRRGDVPGNILPVGDIVGLCPVWKEVKPRDITPPPRS